MEEKGETREWPERLTTSIQQRICQRQVICSHFLCVCVEGGRDGGRKRGKAVLRECARAFERQCASKKKGG